jgi:hypothetical protein
MKKGETGQPVSPFLFIALAELLADFLNLFDRHLAAGHFAGDLELGPFILLALFERCLGQGSSFCVELCIFAVSIDTKPTLEATFHCYAASGFIGRRRLRIGLLGHFPGSAGFINYVTGQCDLAAVLSHNDETQRDDRRQRKDELFEHFSDPFC